ncbi:MAG: hypothetical protein QM773_14920 [Hyphomonadaceae bacterium]
MQRKVRIYQTASLATLALVLVGAQSVFAQPPSAGELPRGYQQLSGKLQPDGQLPAYLQSLRTLFADLDADADGMLSKRDVELHDAIVRAQMRTQAAQPLMRYDIDGDGSVTDSEIRVAVMYEKRSSIATAGARPGASLESISRQMENTIAQLSAKDKNGDGKVTYAEASKADETELQRRLNSENAMSVRVKTALTLDATKNGQLELAAWLAAGEALFRRVDRNADDKLAQEEIVGFWQRPSAPDAAAQSKSIDDILDRMRAYDGKPQAATQSTSKAGCAMPAASAKAQIVLLGAYETQALSSATIGSDDAVVHAGKVVVEPGTQPLYVVIVSHSASIWQFSGAVQRIERVVLSSRETRANGGDPAGVSLVGAVGVPKEKVSFFAKSSCLSPFHEMPSSESVRVGNDLRNLLGRDPDAAFGKYSVTAFNVPSGRIDEIKDRNAGKLVIQGAAPGSVKIEGDASNIIFTAGPSSARDELYRFSPGGVITIDPKSVVSSRPAKTYGVLPQQAGLVQLLASGALKQNNQGEYIVQKQMAFPAGLHGAHSVKFVVPKGVPMPTGDPGHSCVVATTGPVNGAVRCGH